MRAQPQRRARVTENISRTAPYYVRRPRWRREVLSVPRTLPQEGPRHRLTWFQTLQGLALLAAVMLGARYPLLSGLLICAGIAASVVAILTACIHGEGPQPAHLACAILWAIGGVIYIIIM